MSGGLLVITSHPDDEVLIAGSTLAACADAGVSTGVVCLTRGEHGPISDPALATRRTLGAVRVGELSDACTELGVPFVKCFRREDGNLPASAGGQIVGQLRRAIESFAPAAVVTFGEDGLYWHPDHIATYRFVRAAVRGIPDPPELYRSIWPEELMTELVTELRARGLPSDLWDMPPEDFGTDEVEGCFTLDLRPFAQRKLRALRCHRTQISDRHALTTLAGLERELAERFLGFERFAAVPEGSPDGWLRRTVGGG